MSPVDLGPVAVKDYGAVIEMRREEQLPAFAGRWTFPVVGAGSVTVGANFFLVDTFAQALGRGCRLPLNSQLSVSDSALHRKSLKETLRDEFIKLADSWEKETVVFSDPASLYLNKNYMVIVAKGIDNPKIIVPLILDRLAKKGGDWFFALEKIAGENPAENCSSYERAIEAWQNWTKRIS